MTLTQSRTGLLPPGSAGFTLRRDVAEYPKNFTAELREQLRQLGPPPACLRFRGCVRLVYRAARQIGVRITARKQKRGYLIWKRPAPLPDSCGSVTVDRPRPLVR